MIYVWLLIFPLIFAANEENNNVPKSAPFTWGPSNTYTKEELNQHFQNTQKNIKELDDKITAFNNKLKNVENLLDSTRNLYTPVAYLHLHTNEYKKQLNVERSAYLSSLTKIAEL